MSADIIRFPCPPETFDRQKNERQQQVDELMGAFVAKMRVLREDEKNDPLLTEARACLKRQPKASLDRLTKNEVAQLRAILRQYNTVAGGSYLLKHHMVEGRD